MLGRQEVANYLMDASKKTRDEKVGSAIFVHYLKIISSLFNMVGTIRGQYAHDSLAHAFGALVQVIERLPPIDGVIRPEDKKAIMDGRIKVADLIKDVGENLDSIIELNQDIFLEIISKIYETINGIDQLSKHFVSMLPPMP